MCKVGRRMEIVVLVVCINIERRGGGSFLAQNVQSVQNITVETIKNDFFSSKKVWLIFWFLYGCQGLTFGQKLTKMIWDPIWDLIVN